MKPVTCFGEYWSLRRTGLHLSITSPRSTFPFLSTSRPSRYPDGFGLWLARFSWVLRVPYWEFSGSRERFAPQLQRQNSLFPPRLRSWLKDRGLLARRALLLPWSQDSPSRAVRAAASSAHG